MKKTILAVFAAGMMLVGLPAFAVSPTTSVKTYTTTRENARALIEDVANGVTSRQTIVMKPGKKGRVTGVVYNEDVLVAEYNPMQYETVTETVTPPATKTVAAKTTKTAVKKHKATKKSAVKVRHHKAKATANHKVRRHARHYAKKANTNKVVAKQTVPQTTRTRVVGKRNPNSRVYLEQVQEVYVPNNNVSFTESQYVANGPVVVQVK